jgi:ATPase family associated with various cellular activities (AAA)
MPKPKKVATHDLILAASVLRAHFGKVPPEMLISTNRIFPITARIDLQRALEGFFQEAGARLHGLHASYGHETLTTAHLLTRANYPVVIGPLQHEEVEFGEPLPARCLKRGLWLARTKKLKYACLLSPAQSYGRNNGVNVEITVPGTELGSAFATEFFAKIQESVQKAASYRGKVLSFEFQPDFSGTAGSIRVHKLAPVARENVILPARTVDLLERNVTEFAKQRPGLKNLGLSVKKGLLFYGPPGTGKTYTVRYLASQLPNHTTLLITAEHVGLLDHYFQLARHLQPAIIVIEDVDLIGRAREQMDGVCEESMLNKLLNEMDGLREDAEVFFVLTTNRPEQLESALASRPGRIDQAIEFPLPDQNGRRRLIQLYSCGLQMTDQLISNLVKKTNGVSPAFIKELMRRSAQFYLQAKRNGSLTAKDADAALEEMLFTGGALNRKLLGATEAADAVD